MITKFKLALGFVAITALVFAQSKEPTQPMNSLYVEPCVVQYIESNQVNCKAYIQINGIEAEATITEVDYSYLNDVDVSYTLDNYNINEKAVYEELRAYFDDQRTFWVKGV